MTKKLTSDTIITRADIYTGDIVEQLIEPGQCRTCRNHLVGDEETYCDTCMKRLAVYLGYL